MNLEELQSKTIDYIRFPLAVGVVFIHSAGSADVNMQSLDFSQLTGADVFNMLSMIFSKTLFNCLCVPTFFFFSGFLFFYKLKGWSKSVYISKLKSRVKTLIVPYFLWNAIVLALMFGGALLMSRIKGGDYYILDHLSTPLDWIKAFWANSAYGPLKNALGFDFYIYYPINGPLWFVRDLIGVCVLSPLVYLIVRYAKVVGLIVLWILLYTNVWVDVPGLGIEAFFYFSLGAYMSVNNTNFVELARKIKMPAAIIALLMLFLSTYGTPQFVPFTVPVRFCILMLVLSGVATLFNIVSWLLETKKVKENKMLTASSFFIFVSHSLVLGAVGFVLGYVLRSDSILVQAIYYFAYPILSVAVCVSIYYVLDRYFPRLRKFLVGGR